MDGATRATGENPRASTRRTGTSDRVRGGGYSVGDGGEDAEVGASNPAAADAVSTIAAAALTARRLAQREVLRRRRRVQAPGRSERDDGTAVTAARPLRRRSRQSPEGPSEQIPGRRRFLRREGRRLGRQAVEGRTRGSRFRIPARSRGRGRGDDEWATGTSITDAEREPRAALARPLTASTSRTTAAWAATLAATVSATVTGLSEGDLSLRRTRPRVREVDGPREQERRGRAAMEVGQGIGTSWRRRSRSERQVRVGVPWPRESRVPFARGARRVGLRGDDRGAGGSGELTGTGSGACGRGARIRSARSMSQPLRRRL